MRKGVDHLRRADTVLAQVIESVGPFRMTFRPPEFETLARSIVYQQLSGKAAGTIFGRLEAACGRGGVKPGAVLKLSMEQLRALGLSTQKASYVRDLAERTAKRQLRFERLPMMSDEEVIETLTEVKGVGVWTAQMFLMFALKRPDVLPVADLGIRNAIRNVYGLETAPAAAEVERIAQPWRPWATVACWYLWRSLDNEAAI